MDEIKEVADLPPPSLEDLREPIVPRVKGRGHGVLSQHGQIPDPTNVGYKHNFKKVFESVFFKTETFKKKTSHLCQLVGDYQLLLIRKRYHALVEEDSDFVRDKSIHAYIWNIFKKIPLADSVELENLARRVSGDFNQYQEDLQKAKGVAPVGRKRQRQQQQSSSSRN